MTEVAQGPVLNEEGDVDDLHLLSGVRKGPSGWSTEMRAVYRDQAMSLHAELIARLREQSDYLKRFSYEALIASLLGEAADALASVDTEQRAAFEALEEYGWHHSGCAYIVPGKDCDCGFNDALAGAQCYEN